MFHYSLIEEPTAAGLEATSLAALDNIRLEQTYSAKALACLIATRRERLDASMHENVVDVFYLSCNSHPVPDKVRQLSRQELVAAGVPTMWLEQFVD